MVRNISTSSSRRKFLHLTALGAVGGSAGVSQTSRATATDSQDSDVIEIHDWYDLVDKIDEDFDERNHYVLETDLTPDTPGYDELVTEPEKGWDPVTTSGAPLLGTFDGQHHVIRGLQIDRPDENVVGLFRKTGNLFDKPAIIKNLILEEVDIAGNTSVGGIVGSTGADILNCAVSGTITGGNSVGGIAGDVDNGEPKIKHCYADVTVSGERNVGGIAGIATDADIGPVVAIGDMSGGDLIGGAIGSMPTPLTGGDTARVEESYSRGTVSGSERVGGFVGSATSSVTDCYATGAVEGGKYVGGIVGGSDDLVEACFSTGAVTGEEWTGGFIGSAAGDISGYWDVESSGMKNGAYVSEDDVTGLKTEEMQGTSAADAMERLDFADTWSVSTNPDDYPYLQWEDDAFVEFEVVDAPTTVAAGETATVTVEARNTGEALAHQTIQASVEGDLDHEEEVGIIIDGGIQFTVSVETGSDDVGMLELEFESDGPGDTATYELVVDDGLLGEYANGNDVIETSGLRDAIADWREGDITAQFLQTVIEYWRSGKSVA